MYLKYIDYFYLMFNTTTETMTTTEVLESIAVRSYNNFVKLGFTKEQSKKLAIEFTRANHKTIIREVLS